MPSQNEIIPDDEFGRLEEAGITSSYVRIKDGHMKPILTLKEALAKGFFPKGTKVRWIDGPGNDWQRKNAREVLADFPVLTVSHCEIGSSSSTYQFEEVTGTFNTVMFEKVSD
jgi:hypothetical protein